MPKLFANFLWGFDGSRQSMLVESGNVVWRGPAEQAPKAQETQDLAGRYLLPAFVDAHCHILPTGLNMRKLDLSACAAQSEVLEAVAQRAKAQPDGWLLAVWYDQTKFQNGEHITAQQLDAIEKDRPILLQHTNGHAGIANTKALQLAGVVPAEQDPPDGAFGRDASGNLSGLVLESAFDRLRTAPPTPSVEEMTQAILLAGESMSSFGIVLAADMSTGAIEMDRELEAYARAANLGCKIKTRLYLQHSGYFRATPERKQALREAIQRLQTDRCRIAGVKIFSDGAIGAGTAAIYGTYTGDDSNSRTSGRLIYPPERLQSMIRRADEEGFQVAVHAIGDYAADQVMDAFQPLAGAQHHRIEHAMLLSDEQVGRLAKLRCHVVMQPEFLMRLGHTYRRQLGPERASRLKRIASLTRAGAKVAISSDRPVVPGDPWDGIRTASQRPEGFDQEENVSLKTAIEMATVHAAAATEEATGYATLMPGSDADFQVLPADPMRASSAPVEIFVAGDRISDMSGRKQIEYNPR